jgi:hypothetical protein
MKTVCRILACMTFSAMACAGTQADSSGFVRDVERESKESRTEAELAALEKLPLDERMLRLLEEGKGEGVGFFLVDAVFEGLNCFPLHIVVGRKMEGSWKSTTVTASGRSWGSVTYDAPKPVPEGEYLVTHLRCKSGGSNSNFAGPHARFQVKSGELVDVGTLKFVFTRDSGFLATGGSTMRSVQPMNSERLAKMTEKTPKLMKKLVRRPMALIGPPEGRTKMKGWPG